MSSSPAAAWHTLLQPFYILSTVIGVLIGTTIMVLAIRGCVRRRLARTRFVRAVDAGWVVPVFNLSNEANANLEAKNPTGPKPVMRESVLNVRDTIHTDGGMWERALPLSMVLLPTPTRRPYDLLLYLLRTPSFLTSNLFSRLRAIQFVRSEQSHHRPQVLPPTSTPQNSQRPSADRQPSSSSTSSNPKRKQGTQGTFTTEPAQVMFVIAMPTPPPPAHQRHSPSTAHEPVIPIANQELCIGTLSASLQIPVQYLKGGREERNDTIRHGAAVPDVVEEEEEGDYASTVHTRRVMSEDPGHEFAGSFVSSRHMYAGNYGDEASSYAPHRSATASPSSWDDHGDGRGGAASTHETHNSYLAPPSFNYRPGARSHGHGDASSFENRYNARSHESSSYYSPSRAYTPSTISADVAPVPSTSAPPALPALSLPPSPPQPRVVINDPDQPLAPPEDTSNQQPHAPVSNQENLEVHRLSQFTSGTDTTASVTDVDGGYEADADGTRRLTIRPKGAARRRAGS